MEQLAALIRQHGGHHYHVTSDRLLHAYAALVLCKLKLAPGGMCQVCGTPTLATCSLCASEWYCDAECQHYDRYAHHARTLGVCGVPLLSPVSSTSDAGHDSCHSSISAPAPVAPGLLSPEALRAHGWAARRRSEPDLRAFTYAFAPRGPGTCHRSQCEFRCSCRF